MQFYSFIKNIDKILSSFDSKNNLQATNLSLFTQTNINNENVQQNLFTQAIKETVSDIDIEYIIVDSDNVNKIKQNSKNQF